MPPLMDDPLEDLFNQAAAGDRRDNVVPLRPREPVRQAPAAGFAEDCKDCNGSGKFFAYTGRYVGPCFKCKGKGKIVYKTDAFTRQAKREKAAVKKAEKSAAVAADAVASYERDHPSVLAWMNSGNSFGASMLDNLKKWGSLTDKQLAACYRSMERDAEKAREKAEREAAAPVVGNALWQAFEKAKELQNQKLRSEAGKRKKPKLAFADFIIKEATKYPGVLYLVKRDDTYLGKVQNGKLYRARDCSDETAELVMELMADPKAAAIKYGQRYSFCCICGRGLTNHKSIERVMGPICAEKWGWE